MTDRELLYVKTIAQEGSISAAARKLFIAQPSLSQTLARIEDALGTKLFYRTPSGLKLTSAGKKYVLMATRVLKLYDDLQQDLTDLDSLNTGTVVFGITPLLGKMLLPEVLPEFHRLYPNIQLRVVEGNSKVLDSQLTACEISFAVMHQLVGATNQHINYDVFDEESFVVTVAADSPLLQRATPRSDYPFPLIDIHELAHEPLLTVPYRQRIRQVTDTIFSRAGVRPTIEFETRDYSTVQDLAARGMGYTIGPLSYTKVSDCEHHGAQFLSLDRELQPVWYMCLATFKNGSLSRADRELRKYFRSAIERVFT